MKDPSLMAHARSEQAMGHLGRICSLHDLPSDKILSSWIREAMDLNDRGVKLPSRSRSTGSAEPALPAYFQEALSKNVKAKTSFESFPPSHRKEYVQWITEAKTTATRDKRMATAIEWLAEGKSRNWKYGKR